jgi:hypothetical protein
LEKQQIFEIATNETASAGLLRCDCGSARAGTGPSRFGASSESQMMFAAGSSSPFTVTLDLRINHAAGFVSY